MEVQITNTPVMIYTIISIAIAGALLYFVARYFIRKTRRQHEQVSSAKGK